MSLNVLVLVDHAVGISGPHRNVVSSLNALTARDDVFVRLLTGRIDESEPYAKAPSIDIHLGYDPHNPARFLSNVRLVRSAAKGCEVIYVPTNLKSLLYAQLVRRGRRLVAGPNVTHLPIRRADSPGWVELSLMCEQWIENSESRRHHVVRCSGDTRVKCVRHAIDTDKFSPARRQLAIWDRFGLPRDSLKVLYVGRDNAPRKGVRQLVEAIRGIHSRDGRRSHDGRTRRMDFVFVGRMSPVTEDWAKRYSNVHLLGFRVGKELARIYSSSDIAVVPSSWESFGFTVLEAMSSGLAVIAGNRGGMPEIVGDDSCGVLVDIADERSIHIPDAAQILAGSILRLVENDELRETLGTNARRRVLQHFTEDRLGEDLMSVLR